VQIPDSKFFRITFHEITKEAVEAAMEKPREIDMDLVNAQQARRVLDRLVGYSLSPILWKKIRRGLSAGRVQSVAVRLVVEREKEIEKFAREKYFKIKVDYHQGFSGELIKIGDKPFWLKQKIKLFDGDYQYQKSIFNQRREADEFVGNLGKEYLATKVEGREFYQIPPPAYTTARLQQAAARRWGWSGKQTMRLAQRLYERGLISYHRTDALYLSPRAIADFREYITRNLGKNYLASKERVYKNRGKNVQEAHEAIRPTEVNQTDIKGDGKEKKLYWLIWKRAVATQAAAAKLKQTKVLVKNNDGIFRSEGVRVVFEGFLKLVGEKTKEQILPELKVGDKMTADRVSIIEVETNPPARYSEATLIASLERQGIGRPSTYAPIISTIQSRLYVEKAEGKFKPTPLGVATNSYLTDNFLKIVSLPFTAGMEEDLDKVSWGKMERQRMLSDFWQGFAGELKKAAEGTGRVRVETEKIGEKCPECKEGELVVRLGRFGKFISCGRFPECKYTRAFKESGDFNCPGCGGQGVIKRTKSGRRFYGCANYPKCHWVAWKKP
jgi:DNA topoisomerase-1